MEGRRVEAEISSTDLVPTSFCFLLSSPKGKNGVHEREGKADCP